MLGRTPHASLSPCPSSHDGPSDLGEEERGREKGKKVERRKGEEEGRGRWKGGGMEVEVKKRRGVAGYKGGTKKGRRKRVDGEDRRC